MKGICKGRGKHTHTLCTGMRFSLKSDKFPSGFMLIEGCL